MALIFCSGISERFPDRTRSPFPGGCNSHKDIHALPFSLHERKVSKPKNIKYIENPKTIGDYIRNKRLERKLFQKDVAKILKVTDDTIINWENNRSTPQVNLMPQILKFLEFCPIKKDIIM